jgi:hypothetical protein
MRFEVGQRVRVVAADNLYTGCRGTIAETPGLADPALEPLGYNVVIDGENGVSRAFLASALELQPVARVRPRSVAGRAAGHA